MLLAAAVVAGVIALSERQGARSAATAEAAQRLGAQALTEDRLDQALRLANAGVALDDSVATRSSLLSVLVRSPAALGVAERRRQQALVARAQPRRAHARDGRRQRRRDPLRHRDAGANRRVPGGGRRVTWLGFHPRDGSLAILTKHPSGERAYLQIIDAATQRLRRSIPLGGYPGDPGSTYIPYATYAPDGRSVIVGYASEGDPACSCAGSTSAAARRWGDPYASAGPGSATFR